MEKINLKEEEIEMEEFKDKASDWSDKKIGDQYFNEIFQIDGTPLSWFYRPIIYSSLLPKPFVTIKDFWDQKKVNKRKVKLFSLLFQNSLIISDKLKSVFFKRNRTKPETNDKKNVLFLAFTNYLGKDNLPFREKKIINLINKEEINKEDNFQSFILGLDPLSKISPKKLSTLKHNLYGYYNSKIINLAKKNAEKLAEKWNSIGSDEKETILGGEKTFHYFKENVNFLYSKKFIYLVAKYYYTFLRIISKEKIKAIVLSSQNNIFEKCIIAAARKSSIPVFIIQHGIGLGTFPTIDTPDNVRFEVFGEKYKNDLIKFGIDQNNIDITGPIILEGIEKYIEKRKNESDNGKNIFFATSPLVEDRYIDKEDYFTKVKKVLLGIKKVNPNKLIIKLHPREKHKEEYIRIMEEINLKGKVTSTIDRDSHYNFIKGSDLVITFGSTVALEAMIIGRPTLSINVFDGEYLTNRMIIDSGATTIVKPDQELVEIINKLLKDNSKEKEAQEFVEKLCYKIDGKASERIVEHIKSILV